MSYKRRRDGVSTRFDDFMQIGNMIGDGGRAAALKRLQHSERIGKLARHRSHRAARARSSVHDDHARPRSSV
jgi:hypothetical protein